MSQRISGVYCIRCGATGKVYIGSTQDIRRRRKEHFTDLKSGLHGNIHLQRAWDRYGGEFFTWHVLVECEPPYLTVDEQDEIDRYRSSDGRFGFNICKLAYSTEGRQHTPEARYKMSLARRGKSRPRAWVENQAMAQRGKVISQEHRAAVSAAQFGRKHTAEHIAKVAAAMRGRKHTAESRAKMSAWQIGRKMSPEACANNSAAQRGKKLSREHRAKLSAAGLGRKFTAKHIANRVASLKANKLRANSEEK